MYVSSEDIRDRIPISESVKILDLAFPHLKKAKWNERADVSARNENKEKIEEDKCQKL